MLKELAGEKMAYKGVTMSKAQVILLKVIEGAIGGDIQSQRLYMEYMYGKPTQHVAVEASVALPDRTTQRDLLLMEHFSGKEVESESYPV